jgi:hypothetical protein
VTSPHATVEAGTAGPPAITGPGLDRQQTHYWKWATAMNTANEIIEKQDPVHEWRVAQLVSLGLPRSVAEAAADEVDWYQMAALVRRGCPPWLALRILR